MESRFGKLNLTEYSLILLFLCVLVGRFFGGAIFDNHWSFVHWNHLSFWFPVAWVIVVPGILVGAYFLQRRQVSLLIPGLATFVLLVAFGFDSFLMGNGMTKIGQITGTAYPILRPLEFGALAIVSLIEKCVSSVGLFVDDSTLYRTKLSSGFVSWKAFAYLCTIVSLYGAAKLTHEMTSVKARRLLLYLVIVFGPHTIMYLAPVAVEPAAVAVAYWFALYAVRLSRRFSISDMAAMWIIIIVGVVLHFTCLYLVPAALFLTVMGKRKKGRIVPALCVSSAAAIAMIVGVYIIGGADREFSKYLVFVSGTNPFSSYGLFSSRHLGDVLQILFLTFPQILILFFLLPLKLRQLQWQRPVVIAMTIASVCGIAVMFMRDPLNAIVLDFPRMTAHLVPLSILLGLLILPTEADATSRSWLTPLLATLGLVIPLTFVPTYVYLENTDDYAIDYLDKHSPYYQSSCFAFRDAYFYQKDLDRAAWWEQQLPKRSPEYLNIIGTRNLYDLGDVGEALDVLSNMKIQHPNWAEPRLLESTIHLEAGRAASARILIDTCLMIDPYRKGHLVQDYKYWQAVGDKTKAGSSVNLARSMWPEDLDILSDRMMFSHSSGAGMSALADADSLLAVDPQRPYPYFVKGDFNQRSGNIRLAMEHYRKFIRFATDSADVALVRSRINQIGTEPIAQ